MFAESYKFCQNRSKPKSAAQQKLDGEHAQPQGLFLGFASFARLKRNFCEV